MTQSLFVYGTLAPGRPNEHVLTALGGTWQPATVKGHLKPQGWGAEMGYPGLVLDESGSYLCTQRTLTPAAAGDRRAVHALFVRFGCLTSSNRSALSLLRLSLTVNNAVDKRCRSHFVR